ncbi:amidophosphoribosyltransferase [Patescibacteria group bacterium]
MMQKIVSLKGSTVEELELGIKGIFPEKCGLAAAINIPGASSYVFDILYLEEHRGEDGAGIVSVRSGQFHQRRRIGAILENFSGVDLEKEIPGKVAIGQNRYTTHGDYRMLSNIPPFIFQETKFGPIAIGHNGTLVNFRKIKDDLMKEGAVFQSTTDSEILAHLIAHSKKETIEEAITETLEKITAAYSLLILTPTKLFAIRDRFGVRPLSIGRMGDGFLIASENYTFDQYSEAEFLRDIEPGEMIVFEKNHTGFQSIQYAAANEHFCIFEGIYFSAPRTSYKNCYHEDFRQALGKQLFRENPDLQGDFILPVLDSGKHHAIGLSKAMDHALYKEYFLRIHNPKTRKRSYTAPTHEERKQTAFQKLHLRKDKIKDKTAIVIDDSIVRSTTMKITCERLRNAGAKSIIVIISSPVISNICPNGMDHQIKEELVGYKSTVDEIRKEIGADSLIYLSLKGLTEVVAKTYKCGVCTGCFGGEYPVKPL